MILGLIEIDPPPSEEFLFFFFLFFHTNFIYFFIVDDVIVPDVLNDPLVSPAAASMRLRNSSIN
jgi:hypothetical protein